MSDCPRTIEIEAELYSGRPNPSWPLTDAQTVEFETRLRRLPAITEARPETPSDDLGYRGLRVTIGTPGSVTRLTICRGRITTDVPHPSARVDASRDLERWLITTGAGHLDDALLRYLVDQTR